MADHGGGHGEGGSGKTVAIVVGIVILLLLVNYNMQTGNVPILNFFGLGPPGWRPNYPAAPTRFAGSAIEQPQRVPVDNPPSTSGPYRCVMQPNGRVRPALPGEPGTGTCGG